MRLTRRRKSVHTAVLVIAIALVLIFRPAVAEEGSAAQSWVDKGLEISKMQPNSDQEASCYRRAIEADPSYASAHFNLAFVLDSQAQNNWRGADTAWTDLDRLYEALEHYASSASLDPQRDAAYTNTIRIVRLLLETPTQRPPDLQALRMHLRTCIEAAGKVHSEPAVQSQANELDELVLALERRIGDLKASEPSEKLVSAAEITRGLTRHFTRGQSPYQGPRIPIMIHFDLDKDTIRPDSAAQLREVAEALKGQDLAGSRILIEGHTDSQGTIQHNEGLSQRRAVSVKRYLVNKLGVPESRFQSRAYGESRPLVPNDSKDHLAMNRRVEFVNGGELEAYQEQVGQRKRSGSLDKYDLLY